MVHECITFRIASCELLSWDSVRGSRVIVVGETFKVS